MTFSWYRGLPRGWRILRFKRLARITNGQIDPTLERFADLPLFAPNHVESSTGRLLEYSSAADQGAESGKYLVRKGDIVYSKIRPALRKIFRAPEDGMCSADMYAIRPSVGVDAGYLFWAMLTDGFNEAAVLASDRVAMPKVNRETLAEFPLPLAPAEHQRAIADFLDRKTGAIDALIEKKERLIALLAEKRAALIHQAVTKGLDPTVPMKPSGIPWIGDIPAHWQVLRLKTCVREAVAGPYGSSLTKAMYVESGFRVYGQQQVIPDDFTVGDYYISPDKFETMRRYEVRPGDLLVSVMGTIGRVAVVPANVEPGIINPRLVLYRLRAEVTSSRFAQLSLMSHGCQAALLEAAQGSTMDGLNLVILGELRLAVPPLAEQTRIVAFSRAHAKRLDACISHVVSQVARLREYRQALITAAVTGQLEIPEAAA